MSFRTWLTQRRERKATHYLAAHPTVALDILRGAPALIAAALNTNGDLAAAAELQRQSMAYPILTQMGFGGRHPLSSSLPKPGPFQLRRFSEIPPARRAINAICNPILDLGWDILPCDDVLSDKKKEDWPEDMRQRIAIGTRCLQQPNNQDSWRVWLEQVLEDICVGGYGASEIKLSNDAERPLWLWPVDGQSIRINVEWDGNPNTIRYTQSLGYIGLSVAMQDPIQLTDSDLMYIRLNPRTHSPFGLGYLEVAFSTINAYIGAFEFAQRRASNATPNFLIFLGENVDIPTTRQWAQYWQQLIEGYGKAPIIGGGREPKVLDLAGGASTDPLYLKWQEWIVMQVALAFGLSPMKLGIEKHVNRSTSETLILQDWETVAPVAQTVADSFTYKILHKTLGWEDLCFRWRIRTTDDLRQSEILRNRWDSNELTIDEQRASWGDAPLLDGRGQWTKAEWEKINDPRNLEPLPELGMEETTGEPQSPLEDNPL